MEEEILEINETEQVIETKERYFYKKNNKPAFSLKRPVKDYPEINKEGLVEITEEEWNELYQPVKIDFKCTEYLEKAIQIAKLKSELASTDYMCLKFAEGWLTEEEYAPIKAKRQSLRDEINRLENEGK